MNVSASDLPANVINKDSVGYDTDDEDSLGDDEVKESGFDLFSVEKKW